MRNRRVQMYGGTIDPVYSPEPLPEWLQCIVAPLAHHFGTNITPNHVLVNGTTKNLLICTIPIY